MRRNAASEAGIVIPRPSEVRRRDGNAMRRMGSDAVAARFDDCSCVEEMAMRCDGDAIAIR